MCMNIEKCGNNIYEDAKGFVEDEIAKEKSEPSSSKDGKKKLEL